MIEKRDFMKNYRRVSTIKKFCHNIKFDKSPF